jgi:hypothetical protein
VVKAGIPMEVTPDISAGLIPGLSKDVTKGLPRGKLGINFVDSFSL